MRDFGVILDSTTGEPLQKDFGYIDSSDDEIVSGAKKYIKGAGAGGLADVGYATLEGVASGISRLTGDSKLVRAVSDFRNYSKEYYEKGIPDEEKNKFGYQAVKVVSQTPAYIVTGLTGPPGLVALGANAYQQGRDDYLSTMGVTSSNATEDQLKEADKTGAFSAIPIVILERFGVSKLINSVFKQSGKVTIKEAVKRIGTSGVAEGLTEGSQTLFQNSVAKSFRGYDPDREITEDVFTSILLGGVAGKTIATPVVGYQAFRDRNSSPAEEAIEKEVDPDTELTHTISYTNFNNGERKILTVQSATPESAVETAKQGLGDRAVDIKYEGINASDFKVEEEVTPDPVVEEEAVVEEDIATPEPQPAPVQEVDLEAVKEQQDTIDDADSRIADLQSEIEIEKSNIKEARANNKKEIAAVRKSKLPKEEKSEKIEDLKASIQDEVDDINGNIGIYKEEMSGFKKDLRKAKKKLDKLQVMTAVQPDVTAGAAPVTQPASVKLTQKETEFFDELLGNEANRAELLEEVSSLNIVDGRLSIEPTDIQNLNNFISDVAISDGLGTVPPRLKTSKFYTPFFRAEPDVTAEDDTTLTEQDIKDGKEGEQGLVVDTPVTGDVVADAAQIKPSRPVSVPNAPVISRSSLRGKSGFIYFSDRTRVGTYTGLNPESNISIPLQGGMGYAFIPQNVQAEAGWAFTSNNIFTRFNDKVNETDGVGYVALYTKENLRANGTFLLAYTAEVEYALASGTLTEADFKSEINGLRERFLAKKVKGKDYISRDVDWYSLWDKQWKTPSDLQAALDAAGFEVRATAFSAKKATTKNAKPGDLSGGQLASKRSVKKGMPDVIKMIDLFVEPDLADRNRGEIIGAVQFQKGQKSAVEADKIGADNHLSYPLVIRGNGVGVFDNTVNVLEVIKTQKKKNQALRSAETSFPTSSQVGTTEVTAEAAPSESTGPYRPSTLSEFITKDFSPIANKIGFDIVATESVDLPRYNATKGFIEYNPTTLSQRDKKYITAVMREEIIHGAISKVNLQQSKLDDEGEAFVAFMSDVADSLTPDQVAEMQQVYPGLDTQPAWKTASEFTRVGLQESLYGDITESFISKGPAFDKIKKLLKSVQSYLARTLGPEVSTNPEAAGVIRAAAEILQQADPNARLTNQKIVEEATANSAPVFPNSKYGFAVEGKPFNERLTDPGYFDRYVLTMNALLADIDPALKNFSNDYYYAIESKSLERIKACLPFVKKYNAIEKSSKKDYKRLKRLLLFSEASVSERGEGFIRERDELLKKYGIYNDFQLGPRFMLDEILDEGSRDGVEIGKVYDYMPRFINNLEKVKNYYGKSAKSGFKEYIDEQNIRIKKARREVQDLIDGGKRVPVDLKELANKEIILKMGSAETSYYEAIYLDDYLKQSSFERPKSATTSSTKQRTVGVKDGELIPLPILDAYEDIDVALEKYIYNMTSSLETLKIIGRRYTYEDTGIQINKNEVPSELSLLLTELVAANRITLEQATGIVPDIFQRATRIRKQEAAPMELLRSLGYISGLVELTSTLSQLLDTTFVLIKNPTLGVVSAVINPTVTGEMVGIDVEQIASEFVQDKTSRTDNSKKVQQQTAKAANLSNKSLRKLLLTTGFRQTDVRMKNANLTANFNRYRTLANEYYRDRNSNKSKLFISELSYLGLSPNQQVEFISQLKKFKPGDPDAEQFRNAPRVRQVLNARLNESQPMNKGSRALAATEDPNKNIIYMMKSFMVNQLNNARSEIITRISNPRLSRLERERAAKDLLRLLTGLLLVGVPVQGLKDFIAGRLGYLNDYIFNAVLSPLGISTYSGYKIKREGPLGFLYSYFVPVSIQMAGDMVFIMQKLAMGQKVQPKDITSFGPYSEIINRVFGFNTESQVRKYKRKKKKNQFPVVVPFDIKEELPRKLF